MTDEEKEQKEAQLIRDFLTNATPEQRHLFIARSNYDSNYDALNELAADPQLDRASALLMYWSWVLPGMCSMAMMMMYRTIHGKHWH